MSCSGGSAFADANESCSVAALNADIHGNRVYARFVKRPFDFVLALVSLPVCLPAIAVLWLLVRLDGGAGFFAQARVGRGGRVFTCWKLRTMVPDAERVLDDLCARDPEAAREWETNQKLAKDPRITRVGAFLRATSLDELPQIWNVLKGDMSLVGPRPFMTCQEEQYRDGGGEAYFRLRPGITGPWQIDGRGATAFVDRVRFDAAYWEGLSLRQDLRLLLRTIGVVLGRTGQ